MTRRSKTLLIFFVGTLVSLLANSNANAWSNTGHMAIAYLAYQDLTPNVRNEASRLIRLNPYYPRWQATATKYKIPGADIDAFMFAIAATWPDQIRGDYIDNGYEPVEPVASRNIGYADRMVHRYWHYKDLPFSPDGTQLKSAPSVNAVERIKLFTATLASASASDDVKSFDLAWLLHLVGDIHQPLHATARYTKRLPNGDNGGNSVGVCWENDCELTLHSYWDRIFGTSTRFSMVKRVAKQVPIPEKSKSANLDIDTWLQESFDLAKSLAYRNPPIGKGKRSYPLTKTYVSDSILEASNRIALAGGRLANLLNANLR